MNFILSFFIYWFFISLGLILLGRSRIYHKICSWVENKWKSNSKDKLNRMDNENYRQENDLIIGPGQFIEVNTFEKEFKLLTEKYKIRKELEAKRDIIDKELYLVHKEIVINLWNVINRK